MSLSDWENGEFTIPQDDWISISNKIRNEMNELHARQFELAKLLYERLVTLAKIDNDMDINDTAFDEIEKLRLPENPWAVKPNKNLSEQDEATVVWSLSKYCLQSNRTILVRPTQKLFPRLGANVNEFSNVYCSLSLDNNERKIYWSVPKSKNACKDARNTALGNILFKSLDEVKWTSGFGGRIWGSDEYRDDANHEDGFGSDSFDKCTWGTKETRSPLVEDYGITDEFSTDNSYRR
jgi:hypothetical protein